MGKGKDAFEAFVDEIPDDKLTGISEGSGTIYKDDDFRLDLQGVSSYIFWGFRGLARPIVANSDPFISTR